MSELRNDKGTRRGFSLRSVLLLVMLIVAFGVGLTIYTLSNTFVAATAAANSGTSLQSTSTTTATTTTHNCTQTGLG